MVQEYLSRALTEFGQNLLSIQLIKRLAAEVPDLFCNAALAILLYSDDSPGQRYMATLLLNQEEMLGMLSEPWRFTRREAVLLFNQLMTADRSLDVRLAHCLPNRNGAAAPGFDIPQVERALDILDEVSMGRRIVPILGHLVQHFESRISSKAALIVGKRVQNLAWTEYHLRQSRDRRLRANAVEAIWGLDSPKSRTLLWEHTNDEHNRVAGNCFVGLHLLGEEKVGPSLANLANHPKAAFRATCCWAMGKIADSQSLQHLQMLIKDEDAGVRSAALKALLYIRQEEAKKRVEAVIPSGEISPEQEERIASLEAQAEPDPFPRRANEPRVMSR